MRGADIDTNKRSRNLKRQPTDAESAMWYALKNRGLNGYKFVRQAPIGRYFADFLCRERRLIVEIDGSQHYGNDYDSGRDTWLASQGFAILRVGNTDVLRHRQHVLETIVEALEGRLEPQHTPELIFRRPSP